MSIEKFEKVYSQPIPVNGNILVEVVDRDPTRKTKAGIIVNEESTGISSPYFVVVAKDPNITWGDPKGVTIEVGDIVSFSQMKLTMFYGEDMKKLVLMPISSVTAVFKKDPAKKVPIEKDEPTSKIISPKGGKIIIDD